MKKPRLLKMKKKNNETHMGEAKTRIEITFPASKITYHKPHQHIYIPKKQREKLVTKERKKKELTNDTHNKAQTSSHGFGGGAAVATGWRG